MFKDRPNKAFRVNALILEEQEIPSGLRGCENDAEAQSYVRPDKEFC